MLLRASSILGAAGALLLTAVHAAAAPVAVSQSTPALYTQAFVQQAIDRYERDGRAATLAHYNSMASVDGEWYVFIFDENGVLLATTVPDLLGKSLYGPEGIDVTGYAFGPMMIEATEAGRWVDYVFRNPVSGEPGTKHSWVVRHDGLIFGSGWYEADPPQSDPTAFTQALVQKAIAYYDKAGRAATLTYYNSTASVDGEWYVFIFDENGIVIAHATVPDLLGKSWYGPEGNDSTGYAFGAALGAATEEGIWVDYRFRNPVTEADGAKHSWAVRHDGLVFGSGWYEPE